MNTYKLTTGRESSISVSLSRLGGIAALAIAAAYIAIIGLYAVAGAPPTGGAAWLEYLAGKAPVWWAIIGLSVLTNFLFVPVALALDATLKAIDRNATRIAIAFVGLFVVLETAVNWPSYAALVMLSGDYASAASDLQRQIYVAAAGYPAAVIASPLALVYAIGTLSFAILLIGVVMLRGGFGKVAAWIGILTGVLGIAAVAGVSMAVILNAVFATLWLVVVGAKLIRTAR